MGLTCSFSLTWKKEGFTVKASDIVSMVLQHSLVWSGCWASALIMDNLSTLIMQLFSPQNHVHMNVACGKHPALHQNSFMRGSILPWTLTAALLWLFFNFFAIIAFNFLHLLLLLHPICNITLLCCLQLPGAPTHLPRAGGNEHSFGEFLDVHIFLLVRPIESCRSPGQWPMMWEITVYKQIDFLLALWSVTVPFSSFSVIFFNNTFLFSSLPNKWTCFLSPKSCAQCKDLRTMKMSRSCNFSFFFFNIYFLNYMENRQLKVFTFVQTLYFNGCQTTNKLNRWQKLTKTGKIFS